MRIAIISDIHDHCAQLDLALSAIADTEMMICCGDLCSPFIMKQLGEDYKSPIQLVFGNNDGDLFRLTRVAADFPHINLRGEAFEMKFDGKRFAVSHFDNIGRMFAGSPAYDVVCYGHNHQLEIEREGPVLKINPGEIMGELTGRSTCVIYDTYTDSVEVVEIES